jgi:hypothetical protein
MLRSLWRGALLLLLGCTGPTPVSPTAAPQAPLTAPAGVGRAPTPLPDAPPVLAETAPAEEPSTAGVPAPEPLLQPRSEETQALAAAPSSETGAPALPARPTAAVLPPSARLMRGATPTPDVVASSPALAPGAVAPAGVDYARAIKLVQDSRKSPTEPRLEERIEAALGRARAAGSEIEVLGWQAALKGSTEVYQVTFMLRENRQGLRAEWEANLATGEVRPVNTVAEVLEAS